MQNKPITLDKQVVTYKDLGIINYKAAWEYQEELLQYNIKAKAQRSGVNLEVDKGMRFNGGGVQAHPLIGIAPGGLRDVFHPLETRNYLLLCEHLPVYTLGKSGQLSNILISEEEMQQKGIDFYRTNRGGDITFHGPQQVVGYPILDLENFYTDIGRYLRELEEVVMLTLAEYDIKGERSKGETGVWIDSLIPGKERKICAMGVRCSRWITMHGFALNVNTDLSYFENIIPCGIQNKQVTSIEKELHRFVDINEVKEKLRRNFSLVFNVKLQ